jgi:hypothetical protein
MYFKNRKSRKMLRFELEIISKDCRNKNHAQCISNKSDLENLTVKVNCTCDCHQEKNQAKDKALEQASITFGPSLSEGSNEGLENKSAVGTNHSSTDKPVPQPVTSSGDQKSRVFSREN